ncbi:alpha/beta hydrolase [Ottowia flava]|uniref:Alpha/beta hydrolase n=1 Tax=Ottowia flava TaxID=2675430 RepID=A0ABW4KVL4_9BURK|nr:alpha/beta hydrolase [Ottowia sp. GY511]
MLKTKIHSPDATLRPASGRRACLTALGGALMAAGCTSLGISPRPTAALIRLGFDHGGEAMAKALAKHVPAGVHEVLDESYDASDADARLDVFTPADAARSGRALPTIVWVHGGAWVSGDKGQVANYLRILASHGYTVVGVNYSIAPRKIYPEPLRQIGAALRHLQAHAQRLHVDPQRIVLAGDSAGAQLAAQVANLISVPTYAREVGVAPTLQRAQLRGVLLYCGAYDIATVDFKGPFGPFLQTVLWAYAGERDFLNAPKFRPASVLHYVTRDFPPAFVSAGNHDPLESQSRDLVAALTRHGVRVDSQFYAKDHQPALGHEYQFNLDQDDGQRVLQRSLRFLAAIV